MFAGLGFRRIAMTSPQGLPRREKPATMNIALSAIVPLILGLGAMRVTMVIGEQYGWDTIPFVLVGWCATLAISATWLNRAVFNQTKTLLPFLAATVAILFVWV
jgi:hypothetical protein